MLSPVFATPVVRVRGRKEIARGAGRGWVRLGVGWGRTKWAFGEEIEVLDSP